MRVLIFGSRTFPDEDIVWQFLSGLYQTHETGYMTVHMTPFTVIEGQCPYGGADKWAETWVKHSPLHGPLVGQPNPLEDCPVEHLPFPPAFTASGRVKGPQRNQQMLEEGDPEIALGFVDKTLPSSHGSYDMAKRLKAAGIPTYIIERYS